jgi:hypothetical protein
VSPMRYELGFYIPEDILHSHRRENLKSYMLEGLLDFQWAVLTKQEVGYPDR